MPAVLRQGHCLQFTAPRDRFESYNYGDHFQLKIITFMFTFSLLQNSGLIFLSLHPSKKFPNA